jgi:hypothetical protein
MGQRLSRAVYLLPADRWLFFCQSQHCHSHLWPSSRPTDTASKLHRHIPPPPSRASNLTFTLPGLAGAGEARQRPRGNPACSTALSLVPVAHSGSAGTAKLRLAYRLGHTLQSQGPPFLGAGEPASGEHWESGLAAFCSRRNPAAHHNTPPVSRTLAQRFPFLYPLLFAGSTRQFSAFNNRAHNDTHPRLWATPIPQSKRCIFGAAATQVTPTTARCGD